MIPVTPAYKLPVHVHDESFPLNCLIPGFSQSVGQGRLQCYFSSFDVQMLVNKRVDYGFHPSGRPHAPFPELGQFGKQSFSVGRGAEYILFLPSAGHAVPSFQHVPQNGKLQAHEQNGATVRSLALQVHNRCLGKYLHAGGSDGLGPDQIVSLQIKAKFAIKRGEIKARIGKWRIVWKQDRPIMGIMRFRRKVLGGTSQSEIGFLFRFLPQPKKRNRQSQPDTCKYPEHQ